MATGLFACLATAVLVWFGNGLNLSWPLLWFAPLPVLLFAARGFWWSSGLAAFVSFLAGSFSMWHYFRVLQAPPEVWLITYSGVALLFTAAVLLFRALLRCGAPWSALLSFPALWVSAEYVHSVATPDGTAGSLAYSQLHFLPFLQLASFTGPWGMGFALLLFPAALAIGWHLRHSRPRQAQRIVCATLGLIAAVLIFGAVRLSGPRDGRKIKVGLIASDEPGNENVAANGAATERFAPRVRGSCERACCKRGTGNCDSGEGWDGR